MYKVLMNVLDILFYVVEGYCIQYLFQGFVQPKLSRFRMSRWAVGAVWVVMKLIEDLFFNGLVSDVQIGKLLFRFMSLFVFIMCWYRGNTLLKLFLAVHVMSLYSLSFLAGYSLIYIACNLTDMVLYKLCNGAIQPEYSVLLVQCISISVSIIVGVVRETLFYVSIRKIVKSYRYRENGIMDKEAFFYLLPAVTGILIDILVRLLLARTVQDDSQVVLYQRYPALYFLLPMIAVVLLTAVVFCFQMYQEMADMQKERAEKIVLENQVMQMQNSIVEMEHLYDRIRSVRHDMKNHMAVLQELIQERDLAASSEDMEIRSYFEDLYQAVEQLDDRVHTGNAVSDAVISSKFRYAQREMKGIRLDADDFWLTDAVTIKSYDIGIILNNGLDNAIEACMKLRTEQPEAEVYIAIKSFWAGSMYFIEMENSFDGAILLNEDSGFPISTKEDKEVHGIGLRNIRNCAMKYSGDMDCIVENDKFILSVMVKGKCEVVR